MSDIIYQTGTSEWPSIYFDTSYKLKITGFSIPKNGADVYGSIIVRIEKLIEQTPGKLHCEFMLEYYNKSSFKSITDLFKIFYLMQKKGWHIEVIWKYHKYDEDMLEAGESLYQLIGSSLIFMERTENINADLQIQD